MFKVNKIAINIGLFKVRNWDFNFFLNWNNLFSNQKPKNLQTKDINL